jgi:hypothetical protein
LPADFQPNPLTCSGHQDNFSRKLICLQHVFLSE